MIICNDLPPKGVVKMSTVEGNSGHIHLEQKNSFLYLMALKTFLQKYYKTASFKII